MEKISGDLSTTPAPGVECAGLPAARPGGRRGLIWAEHFADSFLFGDCLTQPEAGRRGRLIARFGFLGFLFGSLFAVFYLMIGHRWGALIVVVCSAGFGITPWLMSATRSLNFGGNFLVGIMTSGFAALCCVEGGLSGHAIAWLAIVPLCALLLIGRRAAKAWLVVSFATVGGVIALALAGIKLPVTYPPELETLVSATGYLALVAFMFCLGTIFETGRERAFTGMQEALAKLKASNEQLVYLNNEKNEFLGIAAHDLKNPLSTIILGAEMLQITSQNPKHKSISEGIIHAGTRMRNLITQLLDANAIEQGRYISKVERCDLAALATQSIANNRAAAARKQIELRLVLPDELTAHADSNAAMQILDNLISNAVKYSPPVTLVQIHGCVEGADACISVTDQGPGVSDEDLKKMFGKFTRLSAKPTGGESSNGLGLSIVKKLAEAMSGSVDCRSVLGAGATFTVRLPLAGPAAEPTGKNRLQTSSVI